MRAHPRMPKYRIMSAMSWRLMSWLLLAVPAVVLMDAAAFTSEAHAQGGAVRDIRVVGNRRVEPETVRSYLQFSVGLTQLLTGMTALYETSLFLEDYTTFVQPSKAGGPAASPR